jgi:hypothetical protein
MFTIYKNNFTHTVSVTKQQFNLIIISGWRVILFYHELSPLEVVAKGRKNSLLAEQAKRDTFFILICHSVYVVFVERFK